MKIALLEPLDVKVELVEQLAAPLLKDGHEFVYYPEKTTDPDELARRSADCDVVMLANNPYPAEAVYGAKKLKMIDVAFTGVDHIALDACRECGITVCNAANYSNQAVAELVIGMAIALLRRMPEGHAAVKRGGTSAGLCGREICGRTVGVVGLGKIGLPVAKLFQAFGARVVAHDAMINPQAEALGIRYVTLPELMRESDIVTLHTPNNAQTRGLISREMIGLMKKNAVLINCARGPIMDNQALADALRAGMLAGAAVDVYDMEPPIPANYPLQQAPNIILTPHVAFLTEESMERRAHIAFENLYAYLQGRPQNVCPL